MKTPLLAALPVALCIGYFVGKQAGAPEPRDEQRAGPARTESRASARSPRTDPLGGPDFSLSSLEDVRGLFKKQRHSVASARLTLGVESLSAGELTEVMEMLQMEYRKNPNDFNEGGYQFLSAAMGRWAAVDPTAALAFVHSSKQRSFKNLAAQMCFAGLAQADPTRAVVELRALPKGEVRDSAAPQVIAILGKENPAAAIDLLASEPTRSGFATYYTGEIMASWVKTDPTAAAAKFESLPDELTNGQAAGGLAAAWAATDPEAALEWARNLKGNKKAEACTAVYTALAREDPAAAWEKLKSEPGFLRGGLIGGVLGVVADEDPRKAMEMLKGIESQSERRIAASQLLQELAWSETRLAFDLLEQVDDPAARREGLGNLMFYAAWSSGDLLKEKTAKLSEREKIDTADQVLRGLMRSDPQAARDYFLALPEAQRTPESLNRMMEQYAGKNAADALEFAISLANPQEQTAAAKGLFSAWGRDDPKGAAEGLKKLTAGEGRLGALDSIAASWANTDPVAARQWAEGLAGTERVRALAAVLPALAKDDPMAAGRQLSSLLGSPPAGMASNLAASARGLAGTWAKDDPAGAAGWAASLPAGQWRDDGIGAVAGSWSQYDAVSAAEWIGTLPAGSSRDAAVKPLVNRVLKTDPATAFSWAATIEDSSDRVSQMRETLKTWRGSDIAAARAAVDGMELAPEDRTKLLKELE